MTLLSRHGRLIDGNNEAGVHVYDDLQAADRSVRWREGWSAIFPNVFRPTHLHVVGIAGVDNCWSAMRC